MIAEALAWRRSGPPRSPIRGDELASELGIEPGPELGRLLVRSRRRCSAARSPRREEAVDLARTAPFELRLRPMARAIAFSAGSSPVRYRLQDHRLGRAHGRLHGHQPGHPRTLAGGAARPQRRSDRDLRPAAAFGGPRVRGPRDPGRRRAAPATMIWPGFVGVAQVDLSRRCT